MELIQDAKTVLFKAWHSSVRLAVLSAVFSAAEVSPPDFTGLIPPHTMALLAVFTSAGAAAARLVAQPQMYEPATQRAE